MRVAGGIFDRDVRPRPVRRTSAAARMADRLDAIRQAERVLRESQSVPVRQNEHVVGQRVQIMDVGRSYLPDNMLYTLGTVTSIDRSGGEIIVWARFDDAPIPSQAISIPARYLRIVPGRLRTGQIVRILPVNSMPADVRGMTGSVVGASHESTGAWNVQINMPNLRVIELPVLPYEVELL